MRLSAIVLLGAMLPATPATAGDLIYHMKNNDAPDILTTFDGQPYWKPLARCSAIFTEIGARLRKNGKADAAASIEDERNMFMRAYATRISTDRGVSMEDALAVAHDFAVESGGMADDAMDEDANAAGELLTQCEKTYNMIIQETGM